MKPRSKSDTRYKSQIGLRQNLPDGDQDWENPEMNIVYIKSGSSMSCWQLGDPVFGSDQALKPVWPEQVTALEARLVSSMQYIQGV